MHLWDEGVDRQTTIQAVADEIGHSFMLLRHERVFSAKRALTAVSRPGIHGRVQSIRAQPTVRGYHDHS